MNDITTLIINYKTPDLLRTCVESFRAHYPQTPLLLIDNGSADDSTDLICQLAASSAHTQCLLNPRNLFHGPAMNQGIHHSATPYVFLLDSDCRILQGGFLEQMRRLLEQHDAYAVGRLQHKNRFGYDVPPGTRSAILYGDPHALLLRKSVYITLPPFIHLGAPCLPNMKLAQQQQQVLAFPIAQYVNHKGRGTCGRFGYGLGWRAGVIGWLHHAILRMWGNNTGGCYEQN
ncbi:MAG: glycosyltransferase [Chloroflexi bacterium]|nr:glycosyltransferase [Chloroflexota bacterium]